MDKYIVKISTKDTVESGVRTLGIDCGLAIVGWSIIEANSNIDHYSYKLVSYGVIRTSSKDPIAIRLMTINSELESLIRKFKPNESAIESLFYFKNQKTVMDVGQARGVSVFTCAQRGLEVYSYTPLQVKQSVTGYGKASKLQVQKMVQSIFRLKEMPQPDDAADAIAVGVCHMNSRKVNKLSSL